MMISNPYVEWPLLYVSIEISN